MLEQSAQALRTCCAAELNVGGLGGLLEGVEVNAPVLLVVQLRT